MHKMFCELQLLALDVFVGQTNFLFDCPLSETYIYISERYLFLEFHKDDIFILLLIWQDSTWCREF